MTARARVALDAGVMLAVGAVVRWPLNWPVAGTIAMTLGTILLAGAAASPAFAASVLRGKSRFAAAVGMALTWTLLAPLYLVGFSLGHLLLRIAGKDPLCREFPSREPSCWLPRTPSRGPAGYRNLY